MDGNHQVSYLLISYFFQSMDILRTPEREPGSNNAGCQGLHPIDLGTGMCYWKGVDFHNVGVMNGIGFYDVDIGMVSFCKSLV